VALAVAVAAWAADKPGDVGLQPGKDQIGGPFRPYNVTGKDQHRDKFHCLVSEYGLNPVILVFVRGINPSPATTDLLQKLDTLVEKNDRIRLAACVVFLSDDIKDMVRDDDKRLQEAKAVFDRMKNLNHVAAALDVPTDVRDAYKLDDKAEVTVLFYNKLRVELVRSFPAKGFDEAAEKSLLDELNAKLDALRGPGPVRKKN
jgi:hypothetical protein